MESVFYGLLIETLREYNSWWIDR